LQNYNVKATVNNMPRIIEKKMDDVKVGNVTICQRDDGFWAVPGRKHVTNRGYALQIAKRLNHKHPNIKSPMANLADKTVSRLQGLSSETSIMSA
jgi:hypothetical protein